MKDHFQIFLYFLANQTQNSNPDLNKQQTQRSCLPPLTIYFSFFISLISLPHLQTQSSHSIMLKHKSASIAKVLTHSLPFFVSHPLNLDLYMVRSSPSKLKIWTQQWWDVIYFRIYSFYKGFERDTLEGSHLCLCLTKKKTNFLSLGKDEPSRCWNNTCFYRIQDIRSEKITDLLHSQLITCTM